MSLSSAENLYSLLIFIPIKVNVKSVLIEMFFINLTFNKIFKILSGHVGI
jgi:hypothetical protein